MQETVPRFEAIAAGLGRKAILPINGEFRAETTRCSKCDHLLHDGSVRLDFMTDDLNEAEEMQSKLWTHLAQHIVVFSVRL
jgi:hypothetical protein